MAPLLSSSRRSRRPDDTEAATPTPAAATSSRNRPQTPDYEPLTTPLNPKAQRALASLNSAAHFRQLKEHIRQAGDKLTETAGEANERMSDARHRFDNMTSRKRAASAAAKKKRKKNKAEGDEIEDHDNDDNEDNEDNDDEEDEEEDGEEGGEEDDEKRRAEMQRLDNLEAKVKLTTSQLEERMRGVVDAEYKVSGLQVAIQEIAADAETAGAALNTLRRRARLRERGAAVDADGDEDMDEDEEDEEDAAPTVVPAQIIKERLAGHESQWEQQSLTQR
jgi:E3 SUMO-protein ligase NSE2